MIGLEPSRGRVFARALLTALAVIVLLPAGLVLGGAFLPDTPVVGRFGAFIDSSLAGVWVLVAAAALLAVSAVWLGRNALGTAVVGLAVVAGLGAGVVTAQAFAVAAEHGANVSLLRQLRSGADVGAADERVVFATVDGTDLHADVWRPREGSGEPGTAPRGAVVFVHGGGFVGGSLGMRLHTFQFLADAGYLVVDVEYRLTPPPRWRDAPADVLCALAWVRGVAPDPDRVVLMGESAGGSLALVAGYAAQAGAAGVSTPSSSCGGSPLVPAGVVAISPAADLEGIWQDGTLELDGRPFPEAYVGGPPAEFPERFAAASPFALAGPTSPPTLIVAGGIDHLVRPARVLSVAERLTAAGVDVRLVIVPYADHGFDGQPNGIGTQVLETILPAFLAEALGAAP